jgi:hypothetical protein
MTGAADYWLNNKKINDKAKNSLKISFKALISSILREII